MLDKVAQLTDFDLFATGHYALCSRPINDLASDNLMLAGMDALKDQTFYLSGLSQKQLNKTYFPIGHLNKNVVKSIANSNGLERIAQKPESQGICFVGKKRSMSSFLGEYIPPQPSGRLIDLETGADYGPRGFEIYSRAIGQRAGVFLPGIHVQGRITVLENDVKSGNTVVVSGSDHPALFTNTFTVENISFTLTKPPLDLDSGERKLCKNNLAYILYANFMYTIRGFII